VQKLSSNASLTSSLLEPFGNLQQQLNKTATDTGLNYCLDLVISPIRKIGESPARICKNFLIIWMDEALQCWQSRFCLYNIEAKQKVSTAKKQTKIHKVQTRVNRHKLQQLSHHVECTCSNGGWGLPRQKLERVQVAFLSIDSLAVSVSCASRGMRAPWLSTRSLHFGESPATFPRAQTACRDKANDFMAKPQ